MKTTLFILFSLFVCGYCKCQRLDSVRIMHLLQGEWRQGRDVIDIKGDSMFRYYPYGAGIPAKSRFKVVTDHSSDNDPHMAYGIGFYIENHGGESGVITRMDSNSFVLIDQGDIGGEPFIRMK